MSAITGNTLVIVLVAKTKALHNAQNYLIANLALSDIIIAIVCIPLQFYAALMQRWDMPAIMCKLSPMFQTFCVNLSIFTQIAIARDR